MKKSTLIVFLLFFLIQCKSDTQNSDISISEHTKTIYSDIERIDSPDLSDWKRFNIGNETIFAPHDWQGNLYDDELEIRPLSATDTIEKISFVRYTKDSPDIDYEKLAYRITKLALVDYKFSVKDASKIVLEKNYCIETNAHFYFNKYSYTTSCLVYVDKKSMYQFVITIKDNRIKSYKGDLVKDIIGNIKIDNNYLYSNKNKIIDVISLDESVFE